MRRVIDRLKAMTMAQLIVSGAIVSIAFTWLIVVIFSIYFHGKITRDYIVTGTGTSLIVSVMIISVISYIVKELRDSEEKTRESEAMFRCVFDGAIDGILLVDAADRKFLIGNPMICRMLGYTQEEIPLLGIEDIHLEQDLPYILEQFERNLRGEIQSAADIPVRRKDGSVFYADIAGSKICLHEKIYLLGMFRDTSERRKAEEKIRENLNYHERFQKVALKREFRIKELTTEIEKLKAELAELEEKLKKAQGG